MSSSEWKNNKVKSLGIKSAELFVYCLKKQVLGKYQSLVYTLQAHCIQLYTLEQYWVFVLIIADKQAALGWETV